MEDKITLQVGVKVLITNRDRKYLLVHRSLEKYPEIKGRWDIVGGRINPGKPLLENLSREVMEEVDLELSDNLKLIAAQDILRNDDRHIVRLTYLGHAEGEVKLDKKENDSYKWYTWEELQRLEDVDIYFKELLNNKSLWANNK